MDALHGVSVIAYGSVGYDLTDCTTPSAVEGQEDSSATFLKVDQLCLSEQVSDSADPCIDKAEAALGVWVVCQMAKEGFVCGSDFYQIVIGLTDELHDAFIIHSCE